MSRTIDPLVLLSELLAEGIDLWRERNVLVYEGPTQLLTDELRTVIVTYKTELFDLLRYIGPDAEVARYD